LHHPIHFSKIDPGSSLNPRKAEHRFLDERRDKKARLSPFLNEQPLTGSSMKSEILNIETNYKGWATFSIARIRLPNGQLIQREIEDHGAAVAVLAFDPERRTAILVRQFRAPPFLTLRQDHTLEAIAGVVEDADCAAAAQREALEEAGLHLRSLERIASAWTMPGISTERMTLYLPAYQPSDRIAKGGGLATEHEDITVVENRARQALRVDGGGRTRRHENARADASPEIASP
jgi:nudix-type nucleoside diphosphatase (YffH/AdpP family)